MTKKKRWLVVTVGTAMSLSACESWSSRVEETGAVWCRSEGTGFSDDFNVLVYDAPDACGFHRRTRSSRRAGTTVVRLSWTHFCPSFCSGPPVWPGPGTYPIDTTTDARSRPGGAFTASIERLDASCAGSHEIATGGTVKIVTIGDDVLEATYTLDFPSGPTTGSFRASNCREACGIKTHECTE